MKQRKPGLAFLIKGAKNKAGRVQRLQYRLPKMKDIIISWHMKNLNNDKIKTEMKEIFFKFDALV